MMDPRDPVELSKSVWLDDFHIDPAWIRRVTELPVVSCTAVDKSNETRKAKTPTSGATVQLSVQLQEDGDEKSSCSLILKQVPEAGLDLSKRLGLAREALFYKYLGQSVLKDHPGIIPHIYAAAGHFESGNKYVLMEDLGNRAIDSGILFGPGNPNNWNRDLPACVKSAFGDQTPPTAADVAHETFQAIAAVHATFWKQTDLAQNAWLRGAGWLQGSDRDSWEAAQGLIRDYWSLYSQKEEKRWKWNPTVRAATVKAVQGISWEAHTARLNPNSHFTLVHGDFWPGNALWMTDGSKPAIRLLDWEMTGLGSGPQDLGQYVLSNMEPAARRACERDLVKNYWKELARLGVKDISFEYCWQEYTIGGVERWLWFLVYFCAQDQLSGWANFFHDQIAAFMIDHNMTSEDITQVRP